MNSTYTFMFRRRFTPTKIEPKRVEHYWCLMNSVGVGAEFVTLKHVSFQYIMLFE